jgi:hypothetical protein
VDAVGDVADRNLVHRNAGHSLRHISRLTSPWSLLTPFVRAAMRKRQHGHAEIRRDRRGAAESEKLVTRYPDRGCTRRNSDPSVRARRIVSRFHGRVRREDEARRRQRRASWKESAGMPSAARMLQREKGGMAFVHVEDAGMNAHCGECAIPADAQDDLLFEPHLAVAAVQLIGDVAILGSEVGINVGIEEV